MEKGGWSMARPKEVLDADVVEKAKEEIRTLRNHKVCLRLQAIVSCAEHSMSQVASVMGVDRTALWRWITRFKKLGIEGLYDRPKGHNPAKLGEEHRHHIAQWLERGSNKKGEPVHWTLAKLAAEIKEEFGITIGTTALWRVVRGMGFRQKVPRPIHAKADKEQQETFKKNS